MSQTCQHLGLGWAVIVIFKILSRIYDYDNGSPYLLSKISYPTTNGNLMCLRWSLFEFCVLSLK